MKKKFLSILAILLLALFDASLAFAQNTAAPRDDAEKGKQIYLQDGCYSCHGYDGHGGVAPKLAPRPIPVVAFIAIVRHPPPSSMPTYTAKVISDAELKEVWAYLKSIPDPPAAKTILQLNQ